MAYDTCTWAGLTAPESTWLALGANNTRTYSDSPHGNVAWGDSFARTGETEAYAHELLIRARHELPADATDTQIVERAVILRAQDRGVLGIAALARAITRAVESGSRIRLDGSIAHLHAAVLQGGAS